MYLPSACAWTLARRLRISGVILNAVLVIPSGPKTFVLQIVPKLLPAHGLDRLAGPVDADAVRPALTRIGQQRDGQADILAAADPRDFLELLVTHQIRAPQIVAPAAGVGEQMAQGERAAGWAQLRLAVGIPAGQHLRAADFRYPARPTGLSRSTLPCSTSCIAAVPVIALVMDAIQTTVSGVIRVDWRVVTLPEAAFVDDAVAIGSQRDDAGSPVCPQRLATKRRRCFGEILGCAWLPRPHWPTGRLPPSGMFGDRSSWSPSEKLQLAFVATSTECA